MPVMFLLFMVVTTSLVHSEIQVVDMSHEYKENVTYFYYKDAMMKRYPNPNAGQKRYYWFSDYNFFMGEHGGTHIDSPYHFCKKCKAVEQIPLSDLLSLPLVKLDVSSKTKDNPDYGIEISDFEEWEEKYGQIPPGSAVFADVGWEQYYPDRKTFLGSDIEDPTLYHFPGFKKDTVIWLAEKRHVKGIGSDAPGFDVAQNRKYDAHKELLSRNLWGAEVVANLKKVPPSGAYVSVLPTKMKGGSGAASRIYAYWDPDSSAARPSLGLALLLLLASRLITLMCG